VGMLAAGVFKPDPSYGFPAGAPSGALITTTTHGNLHLVIGSLGFLGLIIATFVFAAWLRRREERNLARLSACSGVFFLAADLSGAILATHHEVAYNLTLTAGILVGFAWLTWSSVLLYPMVSHRSANAQSIEVAS
jgi:ABC-type enterochelin transport system permease subunit